MKAAIDAKLTFIVSLREQLASVETGAANVVTSDGVRHAIYEPVLIGSDYMQFAMGPTPEFPKIIVPFGTMANLIV